MHVRVRTSADLDRCVEMARIVHERDGYPPYLPTDLQAFLAWPDAYEAWVVEHAGTIVGHVALHRRSSDRVMIIASEALQQPIDRLGVVSRLLVDPSARRLGAGRALLDEASRDASARGLWPILDVATQFHGAIRLYENSGWIRAGEIALTLGDSFSLDEVVYLGPRPPQGLSGELR
jgi:GNAT superfamily N-acetyltransferase